MNKNSKVNILKVASFALLVLALALALPAHADTGLYNYNVNVTSQANYSIGSDMLIRAYVDYAGSPVREYPCNMIFYDYDDINALYSEKIYTDELGGILYNKKVGDIFLTNQSYTYSVQCSNTTVNGTFSVFPGTRHTLVTNWIIWAQSNVDYLIVAGASLILIGIIVSIGLSKGRK